MVNRGKCLHAAAMRTECDTRVLFLKVWVSNEKQKIKNKTKNHHDTVFNAWYDVKRGTSYALHS